MRARHLKIRVTGRVQGVFYRDSARSEARRLGVTGYARNERDGSVTIEAVGEEKALQLFVEWCRRGPRWARVDEVWTEEGVGADFEGFHICF